MNLFPIILSLSITGSTAEQANMIAHPDGGHQAFLENYRVRLTSWEKRFERTIVTGDFRKADSLDGKVKLDAKQMKFFLSGPSQRLDLDIQAADGGFSRAVIVSKPDLSFSVSRTSTSAAYKLDMYNPNSEMKVLYKYLITRHGNTIVRSPYHAGVISMKDLINHPGVLINKISLPEVINSDLLDVSFTWPKSPTERGFKGTITLSKKNNWGIVKFDYFSLSSPESYRGHVTYGPLDQEFVSWPVAMSMEVVSGKATSLTTCDNLTYITSRIADSEFSLSNFGLGDFGVPVNKSLSPLLLVFLISGCFFIAGLFFYWYATRSDKQKTTS